VRVLIISCVFPPEPVTSAITSASLAEGLVAAGHEVRVITAYPSRPGGRLYPETKRCFRKIECAGNGYSLLRTFAFASDSSGVLSRLAENISFGVFSTLNALTESPDVVYLNTWPVFATGMMASLLRARRIPYVLSVQDIYPEAMIQQGKLRKTGFIASILRGIDEKISLMASAIVTISENFASLYEHDRNIRRERIHVVYNWLDEREIFPGERVNHIRKRLGISESAFVALYAGNIGAVAGINLLLDAAELVSGNTEIVIVIAGDGSDRNHCEQEVARRRLQNIRFVCPLPTLDFNFVQAAADIMLLPTLNSAALASVPSKMIAYMLAGRPILAAVHPDSDTARFIHQAGCGYSVPPEQPRALADKMVEMSILPATVSAQGRRAREFAVEHFSRASGVAKVIGILEQSAGFTGKT